MKIKAVQDAFDAGFIDTACQLVEDGGFGGEMPDALVSQLVKRATDRARKDGHVFTPAMGYYEKERIIFALHPIIAKSCNEMLLQALLRDKTAIDYRGRDGLTLLHRVVAMKDGDADARADFVERLLELGAIPERETVSRLNAYQIARRDGSSAVQKRLNAKGVAFGPRQSREARKAGIRDFCFFYTRAEGFIYRIGTPEIPFLIGGDHDGSYPCSYMEARKELDRMLKHPEQGKILQWFSPFLDRLLLGEEFSFNDLKEKAMGSGWHRFSDRPSWSWSSD